MTLPCRMLSVTGKLSRIYSRAFGPRFHFKYVKSVSDSLEVAMSSSEYISGRRLHREDK